MEEREEGRKREERGWCSLSEAVGADFAHTFPKSSNARTPVRRRGRRKFLIGSWRWDGRI